jgi:hypothetical protein
MLEEFLKSGYGRILMEQQLPEIVNNLSTIATEMKRANDLKEQELQVQSLPTLSQSGLTNSFKRKGIETRAKADGTTYNVEVIHDDQGREFTRFVSNPATLPKGTVRF